MEGSESASIVKNCLNKIFIESTCFSPLVAKQKVPTACLAFSTLRLPCVTSLWQRILKKLGFPPWISGLPPVWNCELFHIFAVTVRRLFIRSRLLLSPLPGQRLGCCCGAWERWEEVEKEHLLLSYTLLTAADATFDIDSMSVYIIF